MARKDGRFGQSQPVLDGKRDECMAKIVQADQVTVDIES